MNKKIKNTIKNRTLEIIIFVVIMLLLMINDAINHPEDFEEGFKLATNDKIEVNQ